LTFHAIGVTTIAIQTSYEFLTRQLPTSSYTLPPSIKPYQTLLENPLLATLATGFMAYSGLAAGHENLIFLTSLSPFPSLRLDPKFNPPLFSIFPSTHNLSSVSLFWSEGWHGLFARQFRFIAYEPLSRLPFIKRYKFLRRAIGLFGVFALSGMIHEYGFAISTPRKEYAKRIMLDSGCMKFFVGQAGIMILEGVMKDLLGIKVGGIWGRIWTMSWLLFSGRMVMEDA
jgi:hypothetical protein